MPDFVLLNYLRRGSEGFAAELLAYGIQIGVLDTEGGVWPDAAKYAEFLWPDPELRRKVKCACLWGPRLADYIIQTGFLLPEQVAVTGCPRFDLYRRLWLDSIPQPASGANGLNPRVLINTNFSACNPKFSTFERNKENLRQSSAWSKEEIGRVFETEQQAMSAFMGLARRLAQDFPSVQIVLRPHPFEDPSPYRHSLEGTNVTVSDEGTIQEQIGRSMAVIQRSCTTAIESALASVPALSPVWIPTPFVNPMAEAVSEPCQSYEQMASLLTQIIRHRYEVPAQVQTVREQVIADWFSNVDGMSHRRVADVVLRALPERPTVDRKGGRKLLYELQASRLISKRSIVTWLRYLLHLPPVWSFRSMRSIPWSLRTVRGFTVDEIRQWVERFSRCLEHCGHPHKKVRVTLPIGHPGSLIAYHRYSVTMTCA
ncbi:MAG: hypothetical protein L0387_27385 [Acidobacteria bacterium]|nr:hypothetical protein [Acidobacteriota bacterium]